MARKNLQISEKTHEKLEQIAQQRKQDNNPVCYLGAIIAELVNKQNKKEVKQ